MKQIDYIIVGCGLASIAFCEQLRMHGKSFVVFDDNSQNSSLVAAGLYNPVILKRFSKVWKAKEQLSKALSVYKNIEEDLKIKIDYKLRLYRRFTSVEEQNLWFNACDKPGLEDYLSTKLIKNYCNCIEASLGFGEVLGAGRIDTKTLISSYKRRLRALGSLLEERFSYEQLQISEGGLNYNELEAKYIVFAEGFGIKNNPFFNRLPLNGTKGEVLTIKAPDLKINYGIKSSVFVVPTGGDMYYVGATYNWDDKSQRPTDQGKSELLSKLEAFMTCDYEVVEHRAGIRPTVKDRRPLVGKHPEHHQLFVLNGLGTRGVMIAPYVAEKLYNFIENSEPLDSEININRFNEFE